MVLATSFSTYNIIPQQRSRGTLTIIMRYEMQTTLNASMLCTIKHRVKQLYDTYPDTIYSDKALISKYILVYYNANSRPSSDDIQTLLLEMYETFESITRSGRALRSKHMSCNAKTCQVIGEKRCYNRLFESENMQEAYKKAMK